MGEGVTTKDAVDVIAVERELVKPSKVVVVVALVEMAACVIASYVDVGLCSSWVMKLMVVGFVGVASSLLVTAGEATMPPMLLLL